MDHIYCLTLNAKIPYSVPYLYEHGCGLPRCGSCHYVFVHCRTTMCEDCDKKFACEFSVILEKGIILGLEDA